MEDLEVLLTKIREEGVEQASAQADAIVKQAKADAAKIVADAQAEAERLSAAAKLAIDQAERGSQATLKQAARDVVLKLEQQVNDVLVGALAGQVDSIMADPALLTTFIKQAIAQAIDGGAQVVVSEKMAEAIRQSLVAQGEVTVVTDRLMKTGFKVFFKNGRIEHDFSGDAVVDALAGMLRPQLAALIRASKES